MNLRREFFFNKKTYAVLAALFCFFLARQKSVDPNPYLVKDFSYYHHELSLAYYHARFHDYVEVFLDGGFVTRIDPLTSNEADWMVQTLDKAFMSMSEDEFNDFLDGIITDG